MAGLPLPLILSQRQRGPGCNAGGAGWPGSSGAASVGGIQLPRLHQTVMHGIETCFQRDIAAACTPQQHHSVEQGEAWPTAAQLYAALLAELPAEVLSRGQQGNGGRPQLLSASVAGDIDVGTTHSIDSDGTCSRSGSEGQAAHSGVTTSKQPTCHLLTAGHWLRPPLPGCLESPLLL